MLTAAETLKLRLIKQAALRGGSATVSREDKQWVLDISAREGAVQDPRTMLAAMRDGYNVSGCIVKPATVAA